MLILFGDYVTTLFVDVDDVADVGVVADDVVAQKKLFFKLIKKCRQCF